MQRGPNPPGAANDPKGIQAEFVSATGRYQTWASLTTARQFEVTESLSTLPTSFLRPGDMGYITYAGATATVRRIDLVIHQQDALNARNAVSWIRVAVSELGCHAAVDDLEIVAVTRMGVITIDSDRTRLARSISERCAELGRHRQLQGR